LLKKLAGAGAVGWVAPVILSSSPAAAGVFTAKCAPGTITSTNSFAQTGCDGGGTNVNITISFAGACPCGGVAVWCAQKNSPTPVVTSAAPSLFFNVRVNIGVATVISGKVGLGCTDRDGDRQFAVYDWTMNATDNGGPCASANAITPVVLSNRTLVTSLACPSLASFAPAAAPAAPRFGGTRTEF